MKYTFKKVNKVYFLPNIVVLICHCKKIDVLIDHQLNGVVLGCIFGSGLQPPPVIGTYIDLPPFKPDA